MERKLIAAFVKENLAEERTGHDFYHGQRVAVLAERMLLADYPEAGQRSRDLAYVAGMVHDTIDEKVCSNPRQVLDQLQELFDRAGLEAADQENVFFTIEHMSFSKNIDQHYQLSLEGEYVQDADRLESLGAMGIARAFVYGGKHDNKIYDPEIPPMELVNHDQYRSHEETTINHFYEKLFKLEGLMNTRAAQKEAHRRTEYMRDFIREFRHEWDLD
ncbi:hydrolase [Lactobacillus nasalidis]|uniref:Hydrolase n=1 Tax=Lactobacillus nasalidis TaxID=2797258 RepID=A0ABQ3W9L8_9LACO|nr:HD domain-containing protein [Lactobacillus nasalidis]GHV98223.1 hydrolase [Lactobacillus nasalidis]GHV99327.1 hydrolase [Lactobacillus nasalidis]GHW00877.1 hydrolase [Lactobacillus nasalidis]